MFAIVDSKHRHVLRSSPTPKCRAGEEAVVISDELYVKFVDNPFIVSDYMQLPDGIVGVKPSLVRMSVPVEPCMTEDADVVFYLEQNSMHAVINSPLVPEDEDFVITLLEDGDPHKPVIATRKLKIRELLDLTAVPSLKFSSKAISCYKVLVESSCANFTYGVHYGPRGTNR